MLDNFLEDRWGDRKKAESVHLEDWENLCLVQQIEDQCKYRLKGLMGTGTEAETLSASPFPKPYTYTPWFYYVF